MDGTANAAGGADTAPAAEPPPARRYAPIVVIAGPDGSGKTMVADAVDALLRSRGPVLRAHHGVRLMPRRTFHDGSPVREPHARKPYAPLLAEAKTAWLYVDFLAGWLFVARPFSRRGGAVVIERGWWDAVVDPRRYRLRPGTRLLALLGRLLPAPDLTVVLEAPPETIIERKGELGADEIVRQIAGWRRIPTRRVHLDARRPPDELAAEVVAHLDEAVREEPVTWTALPPGRSPRWILPTRPRRLAWAGLAVYQPVTLRGLAGWLAARAMARLGLVGFLPRTRAPVELMVLRRHLPATAAVAVERRRGGRAHVLAIDASGGQIALAKMARLAADRQRLTREGELLAALGPRLRPPLQAPGVIESANGLLVMEAIAWRPRLRPWRLERELATAIGYLWRSGLEHGDLAPWNLLRTANGWALIDWADATVHGLPYFDVFHHLVSTHTLMDRPTLDELLNGIDGDGWIGNVLNAYAREAGLTEHPRWSALVDYLDRSRARVQPTNRTARHELAARDALRREARRRADRP
jgi:hypothetical protein